MRKAYFILFSCLLCSCFVNKDGFKRLRKRDMVQLHTYGHYTHSRNSFTYEVNEGQSFRSSQSIELDLDSFRIRKNRFRIDSIYYLDPPQSTGKMESIMISNGLDDDILLSTHPCYLHKEYPYYCSRSQNRYRYYVRNDSTVERVSIGNSQQDSSHSIYGLFNMSLHGPFISDMFCLKLDKTKPDYYMGEYLVLPEIGNYAFQLQQKDTLAYGANFPVFHYKIRKGNHYNADKILPKVFLYLTFCPQIGILSFNYVQADFKATLTHIDNIPLKEFIQTKGCITPFCDIR